MLKESGLLDHLPLSQRTEIISFIEELILATDVSRHKHFLSKFEEMLSFEKSIDMTDSTQRKFVLIVSKHSILGYFS